jgi:hypothetical protein
MTDDTVTATDLVRERLRIHSRKAHLAPLARDVGTGPGALEAFIAGNAQLSTKVMHALVKDLYHGHAVFDAQADRLRPALQEPARPLGAAPQFSMPLPTYQPGPAQRAPRPENDATPAKPKRRGGWIGSWI